MMTLIITNLIWVIYSMIEGLREGFFWHFKANTKRDCQFELHPIFAFQRSIVLSLIGLLLFNSIGLYSIPTILSMMLIFSFFHNGTYYVTRNKLDNNIYKLGWIDQSTTSTAKMTKIMNYRNRTIFMIIGVLLQVFMYLFTQ